MNSKILYIVGGGHSGSTLLDVIIGSSENVVSLGEVYFFNSYNYDINDPKLYSVNSKICSCKKEFSHCDFWSDVKKIANKDLSISRIFTLSESFKILWNIYSPFKKLSFKLKKEDNKLFFDSIEQKLNRDEVNYNYLIDSSKDPRRLVRLVEEVGKENVKAIHIVRDVRGYVNSYCNKNKWRVKDAGLKTENPLIVTLRWIVVNVASRYFIKKNKIDNIHISYDLFTQSPQEYISTLNTQFNIEIPENFLEVINSKTYHNIHGNLMKFKKIKEIKKDKSWFSELPFITKKFLDIFLYPFNKAFVYRDSISKLNK